MVLYKHNQINVQNYKRHHIRTIKCTRIKRDNDDIDVPHDIKQKTSTEVASNTKTAIKYSGYEKTIYLKISFKTMTN